MYTMTLTEANKKSIGDSNYTIDSDLYRSGDSWGEEYVGTFDEWENAIPENENDAKKTGWYDWFISENIRLFEEEQEEYSWTEYRKTLLDELINDIAIESDDEIE